MRTQALLAIAVLGFAPGAGAEVFCATNAAEFEAALDSARTNMDLDDTIRVRAGTFLTPANGFGSGGSFGSGDAITVEGGWVAFLLSPCGLQFSDPTATVIDGEGTRPGLKLSHLSGGGAITVRNMTFRNGLRDGVILGNDRGGGLYITGSAGYTGDILVERCIFRGNTASFLGGGLHAGSDGGVVTVRNNLAVGNTASQSAGLYVFGNGNQSYVVNNTVVNNVATQAGVTIAAFNIGGSNVVTATNNIFWKNTSGSQTDLFGPQQVLINNDVEKITQTPANGSSGNLGVDPKFLGPDDFRLAFDSPLVDAGISAPLGGLSTLDLALVPRLVDGAVDIGAYEVDNLFRDSFE